jgi:uncharacterized caspase-like protein
MRPVSQIAVACDRITGHFGENPVKTRLLKLCVLLCCLCGSSFAQPPARPAAGRHKRLALLVGINQYKYSGGFQNLNGCVNDVRRFGDLLTSKFGFVPEDVKVLTDAQATRDGILTTFRTHLISQAAAGDTVVFYYAGHGSRAPNPSEPSGFDETIVPTDSRDPEGKVFDITDKELRALFGELRQKTTEITAILDSCHSGTAIRGNRQRTIPADTRPQPSRTSTRGGEAPTTADRGIVFLAGSRADQSSYEHFAEGTEHGAMSYFLALELSRDDPAMTWRDVMDRVRSMVTARYPMQEPQLEGSAADKLVFGESSSTSQPYFLASPAGKNVSLNAGLIHGLTEGSLFDVFPPGSKKFDGGAKPLTKIQLTRVSTFQSEAKIISGGQVPAGARAVERARSFPDFKLRVFLDPAIPAEVAAKLKPLLAGNPQLQMAAGPGDCDLQVGANGATLTTQAADGSPLSPPTAVSDPDLLQTIGRQVSLWAKWFHLLLIDNPAASQLVSVKLEPLAPRPDGRILSGDQLRITAHNNSSQTVFINALDISGDGSIGVVNPKVSGAAESLAPEKEIAWTIKTDVPADRASVRDVIKVFATNTTVDFRPLTSGSIRDVPSTPQNPLGSLLANAALGATRNASTVSLSDWATASKSILIEKEQK